MSGIAPETKDNIMPNVIGDSIATAKDSINAHATSDVTYTIDGDGTTVKSTNPKAGQTIANTVTLVVYIPVKTL